MDALPDGTGEGAAGVLDLGDNQLHIITGGLGDMQLSHRQWLWMIKTDLYFLDASWIKVRNGTESLDVAKFRNLSDDAPKKVFVLRLKPDFGSRSLNSALP